MNIESATFPFISTPILISSITTPKQNNIVIVFINNYYPINSLVTSNVSTTLSIFSAKIEI